MIYSHNECGITMWLEKLGLYSSTLDESQKQYLEGKNSGTEEYTLCKSNFIKIKNMQN